MTSISAAAGLDIPADEGELTRLRKVALSPRGTAAHPVRVQAPKKVREAAVGTSTQRRLLRRDLFLKAPASPWGMMVAHAVLEMPSLEMPTTLEMPTMLEEPTLEEPKRLPTRSQEAANLRNPRHRSPRPRPRRHPDRQLHRPHLQ